MKTRIQVVIDAKNIMDAELKANVLANISEVLSTEQLSQILPILKDLKTKVKKGTSAMLLVGDANNLLNILKQD